MSDTAHVMWGGRFSEAMDPRLDRLNRSLSVDRRLWREDVETNRAWVHALEGVGVVSAAECEEMLRGLDEVAARLEAGAADGADDEDIHSLVERLLGEVVGPLAGKLHTGRSRNDQVATDLRLWTMRALGRLDRAVADLARALVAQAESGLDLLVPAYTHTQRAQPVRFAHWALAHVWPLVRDRGRLADAGRRAAVLPLGAGAIAGSGFPVDRRALAERLGFEEVAPNSIDAVGDRDFAVEAVAAAALIAAHGSRLAEDLILFATAEFGFVRLPEAFTTGSSLMPQKRNPDALEIARGASAHVAGRLVAMLAALKAMPAGYQKDMQENNAALFEALDRATAVAEVLAGVVQGLRPVPGRMEAALDSGTLATDLADLLVVAGVPFREAHGLVGRLVRRAEVLGVALDAVPDAEVRAIDPRLSGPLAALGGAEDSVERRRAEGGTARARVLSQLEHARRSLAT